MEAIKQLSMAILKLNISFNRESEANINTSELAIKSIFGRSDLNIKEDKTNLHKIILGDVKIKWKNEKWIYELHEI